MSPEKKCAMKVNSEWLVESAVLLVGVSQIKSQYSKITIEIDKPGDERSVSATSSGSCISV